MKNLKRNAMAVAGAFALLSGGAAHADLLEYSFTGADGSQRTVPADANYVNPEGSITFALSAGIDRKVRISVLNASGATLSSKTSQLLGANDRITVGGREYYGNFLTLNAPGEGHYTLKAEILAGDNTSVKTDTYPLTVDTTPPAITGAIHRVDVGQGFVTDVITARAWGEQSGEGGTIKVTGITDAGSGVSSVEFFATDKYGTTRTAQPAFNKTEGSATIGTVPITSVSVTPYEDSPYKMGFIVKDNAGNSAKAERVIGVDKNVPSYTARKIKNAKTGVWENYTPGMTIYANPVEIRFQRKKVDHVNFNGSLYGWGDGLYNSSDSNYIYYDVNIEYPQNYKYFVFKTKAGAYQHERYPDFEFNLAPGVTMGTEPDRIEYRLSSGEWVKSATASPDFS